MSNHEKCVDNLIAAAHASFRKGVQSLERAKAKAKREETIATIDEEISAVRERGVVPDWQRLTRAAILEAIERAEAGES